MKVKLSFLDGGNKANQNRKGGGEWSKLSMFLFFLVVNYWIG